jgi:hypothetical protein
VKNVPWFPLCEFLRGVCLTLPAMPYQTAMPTGKTKKESDQKDVQEKKRYEEEDRLEER